MRKGNVRELFKDQSFDQNEIEEALESLPDEIAGKSYKTNYRKYFNKDGTAKSKKQEGQEWADTANFVHIHLGRQIRINRLKKHRAAHKELIKNKQIRTHRVERFGNIKRVKEDRPKTAESQSAQINPVRLRNQLAEEYNRLVRQGDPDTKELREQIHDQIKKLENEADDG